MPRKGGDEGDTRGAKAKAQKAAAAAAKADAERAKRDEAEARAWAEGANTRALKKAEEEARAAAEREARRKAKEELLVKEAAELSSLPKLRGAERVAVRKTMKAAAEAEAFERHAAPALSARGIDEAIAVLTIATEGDADAAAAAAGAGDRGEKDSHAADMERVVALAASVGTPSLKVDDKHPEKRMKAAYKRFEERELPLLKAEYPTLRRTQLNEMLWRKWQKSPENPINAAAERAT